MDIRRLEAFSKVYELGSFSKAGHELLLSQPTISAHVISLEHELGVQLFDRLGRTILPTQAGEILYRYVQQVFTSLDTARSEISLLLERVSGDLSIGASTIPATCLLPRLLGQFLRKYPDVRLQIQGGDSQDIIMAVLEGHVSVGIVGAVNTDTDLVFEPFENDELLVVASPELAASLSPAMPLHDICSWPWLMREPGSGSRKAFEKALNQTGIDIRHLRVVVLGKSSEVLLQYAVQGVGVCALSSLAAQPYLNRGELVVIPLDNFSILREFYTVRHSKRHIFPVLRFFLEHLAQNRRVEKE